MLKENYVCDWTIQDIDIAHRLPNKIGTNRKVIVKFVSRYVKTKVMKNERKLSSTGVYINDDLTKINQEVLMSVKNKLREEVKEAWYQNGQIFRKDQMDHVQTVKYEDYMNWLEMPWPKKV